MQYPIKNTLAVVYGAFRIPLMVNRFSVKRGLAFRSRFPAAMNPKPLIRIAPHVLLDHFGE